MGETKQEKFLPETYVYREQKTMEKNRLVKVRKHVFYKHTNIVTKKWEEKNARKNFSRNTRISQAKKDGINRPDKVRKHVLYKYTNIVTKKWEKIARNFFFQNQRISSLKTMEKIVLKSAKIRFL